MFAKIFLKQKEIFSYRHIYIYPWGKYNNLGRQNLKGWFWDDGLLYILDSEDIKNNMGFKSKICYEISKMFNLIEIDDHIDLKLIKNFFDEKFIYYWRK